MKVGLALGFGKYATPELVAAAGRLAEERGFHSIWVPEHVVFFREYASRYPYSDDGRIPGDPDGVLEPFVALTYLAAHTQKIRLGTGICLVPQRNPVYTAKQAADVDFLSGGRLDLGVGIGWLREEFEALGVPYEKRAQRTREYVDVFRTLWCDEVSSYDGEFYKLPSCVTNPKPVQQPHPPIHFGGESDAALRRVAEVGQGWYGFNVSPERAVQHIARIDELLNEAGRKRDELQLSVSPYTLPWDASWLPRYEEAGISQVIIPTGAATVEKLEARLDQLAARVAG